MFQSWSGLTYCLARGIEWDYMKISTFSCILAVFAFAGVGAYGDATGDVAQAATTLRDFTSGSHREISPSVVKAAKGFAIFHVVDVALFASGKGGPGVVIARTDKGWSGPEFVRLGGAGFGAQAGATIRNVVLVLKSQKAIDAVSHGNVKFGVDLSVVAGPANINAQAQSTFTSADILSYVESKGVFLGADIQGGILASSKELDDEYYGKSVTPSEILNCKVTPPQSAAKLTQVLKKASQGT
jgi:lipid-binding SYLF domain-containing protein